MMVSSVDYDENKDTVTSVETDTTSFPTGGRHNLSLLLKTFAKIAPSSALTYFIPKKKVSSSNTIDTSIIYNGTSSSFTRWVADVIQRQPSFNAEFVIDIRDFSNVHNVLSDYNASKYKDVFEYRYRYGGANKNAIYSLNYEQDTIFVDIHTINNTYINEAYEKISNVCKQQIRTHVAKIQPSAVQQTSISN